MTIQRIEIPVIVNKAGIVRRIAQEQYTETPKIHRCAAVLTSLTLVIECCMLFDCERLKFMRFISHLSYQTANNLNV